jgi:hypothetical protein
MDRELMVEFIVGDMRGWLQRDPNSFWEHMADLERKYLQDKADGELLEIYQDSIP